MTDDVVTITHTQSFFIQTRVIAESVYLVQDDGSTVKIPAGTELHFIVGGQVVSETERGLS
jgi:predicted proteasome-type protease